MKVSLDEYAALYECLGAAEMIKDGQMKHYITARLDAVLRDATTEKGDCESCEHYSTRADEEPCRKCSNNYENFYTKESEF